MRVNNLKRLDSFLRFLLYAMPARRVRNAPRKPTSVLIIKLSAMGDGLCLMPAVRMLAEALPGLHIDWLTTKRTSPDLFQNLWFLRRIHVLPTQPYPALKFLPTFARALTGYDIVIDCDQYYQLSELIASAARINIGFRTKLKGRTFTRSTLYDPQQNEKLLFRNLIAVAINASGVVVPPYRAELPELLAGFSPSATLEQTVETAKRGGKPLVILSPGSSGNATFRRWDFRNYVHLARALAPHCSVAFAGGPDEAHFKPTLATELPDAYDWIGCWSLSEWAWIFRHKTALFLGNDSGLFHLADLEGTRTLGIFGPNLATKWGSLNSRSVHFQLEIPCRPCIKSYLGIVPQSCARGDVACLNEIPLNTVIATTIRELAQATTGNARAH